MQMSRSKLSIRKITVSNLTGHMMQLIVGGETYTNPEHLQPLNPPKTQDECITQGGSCMTARNQCLPNPLSKPPMCNQ